MSLESTHRAIRQEISKYATPARSAELTDRCSHGYAPTFAFARRQGAPLQLMYEGRKAHPGAPAVRQCAVQAWSVASLCVQRSQTERRQFVLTSWSVPTPPTLRDRGQPSSRSGSHRPYFARNCTPTCPVAHRSIANTPGCFAFRVLF